MKKTAIVLFNLGGPDSLEAVRPFLFNLFSDKAIIRLPTPLRQFVAWMISSRREETAREIYSRIGGRSPILENTEEQASALERLIEERAPTETVFSDKNLTLHVTKCFIAMRYWHPFVEETVARVKRFHPDEIILLPLYPQFSTTTTASSLKAWHKAAARLGMKVPTKTIGCYPTEPGFIATLAAATRRAYDAATQHGTPRVLFTAHGLPEKIVRAGDPYQWQCEQTAAALAQALNIPGLDWMLCYQSRVGPLTWIGPATEDEVVRAGHDKVPVVMVPIAFVSEHSETLVELDLEYRALAEESGVPHYAYVPTVSTASQFIAGLANLVAQAQATGAACIPGDEKLRCPQGFSGCICR